MSQETEPKKCPVCGIGDLMDVNFHESGSGQGQMEESVQLSDSNQVETYSCGHEASGPPLDQTAREEELQVEHRHSEDTIEPL